MATYAPVFKLERDSDERYQSRERIKHEEEQLSPIADYLTLHQSNSAVQQKCQLKLVA